MEEHDNTRKPSRVNETNQHSALRTQQAERRRIQKLLTDIQSQQKAILDSIPDMAWFKDKESKYIAVNEMFGQTCGWKPKDIVGKTDLDIWPRHLAERYRADDSEVIESGKRKCIEEPLTDKDGKMKWLETIKTPIYNEKGEIVGTTGIARDITERKQIEEKLRQSEDKFRTLLENLNIGVYRNTAEGEGRFLEMNPAHYKMFGYDTLEEFMNTPVAQLYVNPQERQAFVAKIKRQGFVKAEELFLRKKDGTPFWAAVTARAHCNEKGEIDWIDGVIDDISERKRLEERLQEIRHELEIKVKVRTAELTKANEDLRKYINEQRKSELALQESRKRLADMINFLPDATFVIDTDGNVLAWNKAIEELTGVKAEDIIGKGNYEYALPFYNTRRPLLADLVLNPNPEVEREYPFIKREKDALITEEFLPHLKEKGVNIWAKAVPLYNAEGLIIGAIESLRDISELKETQKALEKSELQYRLTLDSMNQAIHVVDRELRIILFNDTFCRWNKELGVETNLLGRNVFEAFPFLSDKVRDEYRRVFETGKVLVTEEVNELKGREVITETRKIPIFSGKEVVRVVTVIEDITIRKRLEYILRESEERYKRIAEVITDYIFTVYVENGRPARTVYGPTCVAVTGYNPEEFQADPYLWIKMVPEDDRKIVQEYTTLILSGEKNLSFEHRIIKKDGSIRWVKNTSVAHQDNWGNLLSYDGLIQDITERRLIENRLTKINECFLGLGTNPVENINRLTALAGDLLGADCVLYNRLEGRELQLLSSWNVPADYKMFDNAQGHVCLDVIEQKKDDVFVVRDLQHSVYAKTDPNVTRYNLHTYLGYPVKVAREYVGVLCAVYRHDYIPTTDDKKIIGIIASALGVEEERRKVRQELEHRIKFESIVTSISTRFVKIGSEETDSEIQRALQLIGEFNGVDRAYIFRVNEQQGKADNIFEWCAEGIEPLIEGLQGLTGESFPWFAEKLRKAEITHISRLSDFPAEAQAEKEFIQRQGVKSMVIVPMIYGQSIVGFIGFDSVHKEKSWSAETVSLLNTVGEVFTNALERKYAEQEIREAERFLASIFSSIQDGISILDKEFNIIRVNSTMERWYAHSMPLVGKKCYEVYHGRSESCKVCPTRRTFSSTEAAHDVVAKVGAGGEIVGWLDLFTFPFIDTASGQLKGVIEYVRDITERKRAEKKLEILNRELMNSNKRLKQLALRDSHTGLFNHRYLEEAIEAEFYRARRYAHPISVLMIDIDYFKSINDVYGHQFGDLALKQIAGFLKKMVRRYDIIIRFGGEEFVIICPGADRATSLILAQRILDTINAASFGNRDHTVRLKLSIAVASYPEDRIAKGIDMVELSDQILDKVKEYGGNRVYSSLDLKKDRASTSQEKKKERIDAIVLQEKLEKLNKRANQSLIEAVFAFAKTIEVKDHYTGEHVEKTVHYAVEIANALKLPRYETELIKQAAMLHDLGKIGISEKVLLKNSKLKKEEYDEIKKHPQIGADILRPIQFFHNIIPLILYHHERWDGKGYPRGLKGEEIPIGARIIAIADVYQALISDRPYRKKAYTKEEAIEIIKDGAGTQFDPKIVTIFLSILKKEK